MAETMLKAWNKSLDDSFYAPDDEEKTFMQVATGIESDEELRAHIVTVQTKAFSVCDALMVCPRPTR